jgi:hypothetical protein
MREQTMPEPTNQYLIRVYHSPLGRYVGPNGPTVRDDGGNPYLSTEIDYSDYLTSLPGQTADLSHICSRLAFADACLLLETEIRGVVVFKLSEAKAADHYTPVAVFHPFRNEECKPFFYSDDGFVNGYYPDYMFYKSPGIGQNPPELPDWRGFRSYDIQPPTDANGAARYSAGPFMVANIARAVESGRYKLQYYKRAVSDYDFFLSHKSSLVLATDGPLKQFRFKLYQEAIETLPYSHSSYAVNEDGSLTKRPVALTDRVLNGVTLLSQQRLMFIRRKATTNIIIGAWHKVTGALMSWFYVNELDGKPRPGYFYVQDSKNTQLVYTRVPAAFMYEHLDRVTEFLNMVGIATGNDSLVMARPRWNAGERGWRYAALYNSLDTQGLGFSYYVVKGETRQLDVFNAMLDIVSWLYEKLDNFEIAAYEIANEALAETASGSLAHGLKVVKLHNDFALQWFEMQQQVLILLGLLFTWQLTWDLREPTRAKTKEEAIRIRLDPPIPEHLENRYPRGPVPITTAPDMLGRFAEVRPLFVPFRLQGVVLFPNNINAAEQQAEKDAQEEQTRLFLDQLRQEESNRRQERRQEREKLIAELKKEWIKENVPNPEDPYDYRNWTNREYWKTRMLEPVNIEFAANALKVPSELDLLGFGGGGGGAAGTFVAAGTVDMGEQGVIGIGEFVAKKALTQRVIGFVPVTRFVTPTATGVGLIAAQAVGQGIVTYLDPDIYTRPNQYSSRQLWPQSGD